MDKIVKIARKYFKDNGACRCGGAHEICLGCKVCRAQDVDRIFNPQDPIESMIDATILRSDALVEDVHSLCEMALEYQTASVCVNTFYIPYVKHILGDEIKSCTVINFPLGASEHQAVVAEAKAAIDLDIDELDIVQNLAAIRNDDFESALATACDVAEACRLEKVLLKVILETCLLTDDQIILSSLVAKFAGAEFVKTSTGFGSAGANPHVVSLMRKTVGPKLGVKASGGVKSQAQAMELLAAGANRLGASSVKAILT